MGTASARATTLFRGSIHTLHACCLRFAAPVTSTRRKTRYGAPGQGLPRRDSHPLDIASFAWRTSGARRTPSARVRPPHRGPGTSTRSPSPLRGRSDGERHAVRQASHGRLARGEERIGIEMDPQHRRRPACGRFREAPRSLAGLAGWRGGPASTRRGYPQDGRYRAVSDRAGEAVLRGPPLGTPRGRLLVNTRNTAGGSGPGTRPRRASTKARP